MRAYLTFSCVSLIVSSAFGQQFQRKATISLNAGVKPAQVFWVDADNDSLLDIVLTDTSLHQVSIVTYSKPVSGPVQKVGATGYATGTMTPFDFNRDNKIDFIISGTTSSQAPGTEALLNQGQFTFQPSNTPLAVDASKIEFQDLNNDGQPEAIVIKIAGSLAVYKNNHQTFIQLFDSTHLVIQDFVVYDVDGNGYNDIVYSGKNQSGQPVLAAIEFKDNFDTLRTVRMSPAINGRLKTGDLDHDGLFDILAAGQNSTGSLETRSFMNKGTYFVGGRSFTGLKNAVLEIADLDSDGKADIAFLGQNSSDQPLAWITTFAGDSIPLAAAHVVQQAFGDYDRDGDLDLLQVTDTLSLTVWENTESQRNKGPFPPSPAFGTQLYSRFFAYWGKSADDHTPTSAVTYDLVITGSQPVVTGDFDLKLLDRLLVTNGNQGTRNFDLIHASPGSYGFDIQSVDNSYTPTGKFSGSGLGTGVGQTCNPSLTTRTVYFCDTTAVKLSSGRGVALWFSFSDGYLGSFDSLSVKPAADTVFSFSPQSTVSCNDITVFLLQKSLTDTVLLSFNKIGCLDSLITLSVDRQWHNVTWKNATVTVGNGDSIRYMIKKSEILTATGKNNDGCYLRQTDSVRPDVPVLTLNGDDFKIMAGQSVQLIASGGKTYHWDPPTGLDNISLPDPTATPAITTTYAVTMVDSIGCTAQGSVQVEVAASAFIPNLFTPNGDGKNDELKVYGLNNPREFHLTVFNREGAVVYETRDWIAASGLGWNGTSNGTVQPSGLYFWKVDGKVDPGSPLQLDGKTKGSVLLVR